MSQSGPSSVCEFCESLTRVPCDHQSSENVACWSYEDWDWVSHVEGSGGHQPAIMTHLADEGAEIGQNHC